MHTKQIESGSWHTPAPWGVESDGCTVWMDNQIIGTALAPDGATLREQRANARLIAAAPDLLAALQRLIASDDAHDMMHAPDGDDVARMFEYVAARDAARAAIAKATP